MSPDPKIDQHSLYDPSLHSPWMSVFQEGYSTFDQTGLPYPEPIQAILPMPVGQVDCLCPERMTETGICGWDQSVLGAPNQFYTFHT